jgi:hypothetical protein
MEPEDSLPSSEQTTTDLKPEPDKSDILSRSHHLLPPHFLEINLNIVLLSVILENVTKIR